MYRLSLLILTALFSLFCGIGQARQLASGTELRFHQDVGGTVRKYTVTAGESLVELARLFDVGYNEIMAANPGVDPFVPGIGTAVTIPGQWILPEVQMRQGIVINLAEMRLYYFLPRSRERVETFPVGIGDEGWDTPTGTYTIIEKKVNPPWRVPASIRAERPELPAIVPSGPDNPLGTHALRLSLGSVLIHGTNRPFGIGRRVSHGCIHLYPEDILRLFRQVRIGTGVTIVRQPVKAAKVNGRVLVEIHRDGEKELEQKAVALLERRGLLGDVDLIKMLKAVAAASGIPTDVTAD